MHAVARLRTRGGGGVDPPEQQSHARSCSETSLRHASGPAIPAAESPMAAFEPVRWRIFMRLLRSVQLSRPVTGYHATFTAQKVTWTGRARWGEDQPISAPSRRGISARSRLTFDPELLLDLLARESSEDRPEEMADGEVGLREEGRLMGRRE